MRFSRGNPREKPLRPDLRGERWKLKDGAIVTVLRKLGRDALNVPIIEVVNERGALEAILDVDFKERIL